MVQCMKNLFLSLFIAFTLIAAPVAHAMNADCIAENGKVSVEKDFSKDEKQGQKAEKSAHNCSCSHSVCDRIVSKVDGPVVTGDRLPMPTHEARMTSLSVGPPLEPPSHA
jgi:hypothetical protein